MEKNLHINPYALRLSLIFAVILIFSLSSLSHAATPKFSVGGAYDNFNSKASATATAPTTYGPSTSYICAAASGLLGVSGDAPAISTRFGPAGYFNQPNPSTYGISTPNPVNSTVLIWSQSANGCYATQAYDYGQASSGNLQAAWVGAMGDIAIAVNASIASSSAVGTSAGIHLSGSNFTSGSDKLSFTVPASESGDSAMLVVACSAYECSSITVPTGCFSAGSGYYYGAAATGSWDTFSGWTGDDAPEGGYPTWSWYGDPTINLYSCSSLAAGTYSVTAIPTSASNYAFTTNWYPNGPSGTSPYTPYVGYCSNYYAFMRFFGGEPDPCINGEAEIAAYILNTRAPPLNVPSTLTSLPALPTTLDVGSQITLSTSNIGGGTPPYTVSYVMYNPATKVGVFIANHTGVTASTDSYTWIVPASLANSTVEFDVDLSDAKDPYVGAPAYTSPLTIAPLLSTPTIVASTALNTTAYAGTNITFTMSNIGGGIPPYTLNEITINTTTKAVVTSHLITGVTGAIPITTWTVQSSSAGNTVVTNVVVTDSGNPALSTTSAYTTPAIKILSSAANVLIVTAGAGDSVSIPDLQDYQKLIYSQQGLTSMFMELDSANYTALTGLSKPSLSSSASVKAAINKLEAITGAHYLIILGDATIVPMSSVAANSPEMQAVEVDEIGLSQSVIPTDDPYGNLTSTGTAPSIVVARMPSLTAAGIDKILEDVVNVRTYGNSKLGVVTDTSTFPGTSTTMINTTDFFLQLVSGNKQQKCDISGYCYTSPSYCTANAPMGSNCSIASLTNFMQTYGVQYYGCHGDGWLCASSSGQPILTQSGTIPSLGQNPVILMTACFGAEIPGTAVYTELEADTHSSGSLAESFFNSGASAYTGSTIPTIDFDINDLNNTSLEAGIQISSAAIYLAVFNSPTTNPIPNLGPTPTLGNAFLAIKTELETSSNPAIRDQGYGLQLYGDPILTYKSLG